MECSACGGSIRPSNGFLVCQQCGLCHDRDYQARWTLAVEPVTKSWRPWALSTSPNSTRRIYAGDATGRGGDLVV
jgi:transposase